MERALLSCSALFSYFSLVATKSATEEGRVAGGGTTLLYISNNLKNFPSTLENSEEKIGAEILLKAIQQPIKQIAINAGENPGEIMYISLSKNSPTLSPRLSMIPATQSTVKLPITPTDK